MDISEGQPTRIKYNLLLLSGPRLHQEPHRGVCSFPRGFSSHVEESAAVPGGARQSGLERHPSRRPPAAPLRLARWGSKQSLRRREMFHLIYSFCQKSVSQAAIRSPRHYNPTCRNKRFYSHKSYDKIKSRSGGIQLDLKVIFCFYAFVCFQLALNFILFTSNDKPLPSKKQEQFTPGLDFASM